jgi:hypothetical protein
MTNKHLIPEKLDDEPLFDHDGHWVSINYQNCEGLLRELNSYRHRMDRLAHRSIRLRNQNILKHIRKIDASLRDLIAELEYEKAWLLPDE